MTPLPGISHTPTRKDASEAAAWLRRFVADPLTGGQPTTAHLLLGKPRRGLWVRTWPAGLSCHMGKVASWHHALLPAWEYDTTEMQTEMLADLDHLAATGEQPKGATR